MALVNIESAMVKALTALKKMPVGQGLEMLSYKRNRGISILRTSLDHYRVWERGYLEQDVTVTEKQISRTLKGMMKREFPRSRKVRIYHLGDHTQLGLERKKL